MRPGIAGATPDQWLNAYLRKRFVEARVVEQRIGIVQFAASHPVGEDGGPAKLDQGQQIQTSDPELGAQLLECETGEAFRAWCEPSQKANKFYLESFENAPAEAVA